MKRDIKVVRYGIILAVLLSLTYYFFFEVSISETRLTYTVSEDEYESYLNLPDEVIQLEQGEVFLSANYESISDTLQSEGIRRFELKKFEKGQVENQEMNLVYFSDRANLEVPKMIKELSFGESKPIGRTIGVTLIIVVLSLLLDFILNRRTFQREKQ